jgi:hypothetical protein
MEDDIVDLSKKCLNIGQSLLYSVSHLVLTLTWAPT